VARPEQRDFLAEYLEVSPTLPSFALWRAVELRLLAALDFPAPVLDLGCGNGRFAEMLLGMGGEAIGLDLDWADLRQARRAGAYRAVTRGDATRLPFAADSFGSVLANCVLEHIPEDEAVLTEVARVLRPGGQFAFTVPAPSLKGCLYMPESFRARGEVELAEAYLADFDRRLVHVHYHSQETWTAMLAGCGLGVLRCEPYLPAAAVAVWDRLEHALTQPVFRVLDRRELRALVLCPRWLRTWLLRSYLRRYYLMDAVPDAPHGCWLVVAAKGAASGAK
jgi:SAM-dependent methyltransferase